MQESIRPEEEATVKAFVVRERQERFLELLPNPKKRKKFTEFLAHPNPNWFDSRYVKSIPPAQHDANSIADLLRAKGARSICWAISEDANFDAKEVNLGSVLQDVIGRGIGIILCCVPGELAFVESEDGRFILEKPLTSEKSPFHKQPDY